jgi:hypothetical protein
VLLGSELGLLHGAVRGHAGVAVLRGELVHRVVERVEAGERDELELVAHGAELSLERAMVASSRFFFQLNEGEQLYASILFGNFALMASEKRFACFEVGRRSSRTTRGRRTRA